MSRTRSHDESMGETLGRVASGTFVLALERDGKRHGMLCTWVNQCAFVPPMISVGIKKERPLLSMLEPGQMFAVNILSKRNTDIFKVFARPEFPDEDRFAGLITREGIREGPVFDSAVAYLGCTVVNRVETGDHVLIIAEVTSGELLNGKDEPRIHLRKTGFQY